MSTKAPEITVDTPAPETPAEASDEPRGSGNRLAFVLCGGGMLGSIQVGVLEALLERDVVPDIIVGTSVGALNGAWLAKHPTLDGVRRLKEVWLAQTRDSVFSGGRLRALLRLLMGRDYIYTDKGIADLVCRYIGDETFEEMKIPLYVTALNLDTGTLAEFSSGPIAPALMASTALPGVLPPVTIDDNLYVDGGFMGNCPVGTAWDRGAYTVIYIDHSHPPTRGFGIAEPLARAVSATLSHMTKLDVERFQGRGRFFRLSPQIELPESSLDDLPRTEALKDASKRWTDDFLQSPDAKDLWDALDNRESTVRGRIRNLSRRLHAPGWLQHLINQEGGYPSRP